MEEIDGDCPCLLNIMVAILLYVDNVVLLPKFGASLRIIMNLIYEFCTSYGPEVNLSKVKIMIFGCNKRELNQEAFYLDKDPIKTTHEYKYHGIDFYTHKYFEPSIKRRRIASMKTLMGTMRK